MKLFPIDARFHLDLGRGSDDLGRGSDDLRRGSDRATFGRVLPQLGLPPTTSYLLSNKGKCPRARLRPTGYVIIIIIITDSRENRVFYKIKIFIMINFLNIRYIY